MKHCTRPAISLVRLVFFILFCLLLPSNAYAYLDPGTGSYIFQLIVAALIGALFTVKLYWQKVKTFFKSLIPGKNKDEDKN